MILEKGQVRGTTLCFFIARVQKFWTYGLGKKIIFTLRRQQIRPLNSFKVHLNLKELPCNKFHGVNIASSELFPIALLTCLAILHIQHPLVSLIPMEQ